MTKYNHMITVAFSVDSDCIDGLDCLANERYSVVVSLIKRLQEIIDNDEFEEAFDVCDTYSYEE